MSVSLTSPTWENVDEDFQCSNRDVVIEFVSANGVRFAYLAQGEGPFVILLHGFPDNAWSWSAQLEAFAKAGFRAVAPFLRGYAPTEVPQGGKYDPGTLAADVHGLIAALSDTGRAYVLSMDWGGTATHAALVKHPDSIIAAAVMNTAHPMTIADVVRDPALVHQLFHFFFFQTPTADEAVPIEGLPFVDYLWRHFSPDLRDADHIESVKATLGSPGTMQAVLEYYRALTRVMRDRTIPVGEIRTPTLSIFGEIDATAKYAHLEEKVFRRPYRRIVMPGVGHFPHREREAEVNKLVLDWFAAHPAP